MSNEFVENKVEEALQLLSAQLEHMEQQNRFLEELNHRISNLETELALSNHMVALDKEKEINGNGLSVSS